MRTLLSSAFLALLLAACSSSTDTSPDNQITLINRLLAERDTLVTLPAPPASDTLIGMNRTICFGACPAYGVVIQGDGHLYYNGHKDVGVTGRAETNLSSAAVAAILRAVNESGVLSMDNTFDCTETSSDAPSALLTVRINGIERQISHYHGCVGSAKSETLLKLENAIDSIANTQQWTGE